MELLDNSSLITGGLKSPELIGIMDSYIQKTRCGYKYMFITVNPRPGTELDFLVARMSKFLRKCWVSEFIYCYEQRGDVITTPLGSELHVHILVKLTKYKRPSDVKRETWNTFKNCCGNKQHVLVKPSMESTNFVNYIMGEKKDPKKTKAVEFDRQWREEVCLLDFYSTWKNIPEREASSSPGGERGVGLSNEEIIIENLEDYCVPDFD